MRLMSAAWPGRIAIAAVAALVTIALSAGPAAAATWTVTPGGPFTGHAGTTKLEDTTDGNSLNCTSSILSGTFKAGSGLSGADIGAVTGGGKFLGCTDPLPLGYTVTLRGLPWHLSVASEHGGVVRGAISGVEITVSLPGCNFTIGGTAAGCGGSVPVAYSNSAHTLALLKAGAKLRFLKVSGCAGLVHDGDAAAYTASYTLSPAQVITSR